ncbi:MAG: hypothetical protein KDM64_10285 [Verrucomicrobiae bacterium]|nr:hypothetical protein [Verrucomicrobiae bacterium]
MLLNNLTIPAMFFFVILFAVGIIAASIIGQKRKRIESAFSTAARRLDLSFTMEGGLAAKPWIYGVHDGFRIDIRPFKPTSGDSGGQWTGYRIAFRSPVEIATSGANDVRQRTLMKLSRKFRESEVDREGIFCARPMVPDDAGILISDTEYLLEAARLFSAPPLPAVAEPIPIPEAVSIPPIPESATPPPLPVDAPALPQGPSIPEVVETPASVPAPTPAKPASPEPSPRKATDSEPSSLEKAAMELFAAGQNHYAVTQLFGDRFQEKTVDGSGRLTRVDRFSHDRIFGRGPGLSAEIALELPATEATPALFLTLVVALPNEEDLGFDLRQLRDLIGSEVAVCGVLLRCDPFIRRLYLRDGLLDHQARSIAA